MENFKSGKEVKESDNEKNKVKYINMKESERNCATGVRTSFLRYHSSTR